ncbi:MAG: hypothetical protein IJ848_04210 [Alphaproteobacteria bacterium]|nr:hypothetical protein [Alphaproteobacteria bacterium]
MFKKVLFGLLILGIYNVNSMENTLTNEQYEFIYNKLSETIIEINNNKSYYNDIMKTKLYADQEFCKIFNICMSNNKLLKPLLNKIDSNECYKNNMYSLLIYYCDHISNNFNEHISDYLFNNSPFK